MERYRDGKFPTLHERLIPIPHSWLSSCGKIEIPHSRLRRSWGISISPRLLSHSWGIGISLSWLVGNYPVPEPFHKGIAPMAQIWYLAVNRKYVWSCTFVQLENSVRTTCPKRLVKNNSESKRNIQHWTKYFHLSMSLKNGYFQL